MFKVQCACDNDQHRWNVNSSQGFFNSVVGGQLVANVEMSWWSSSPESRLVADQGFPGVEGLAVMTPIEASLVAGQHPWPGTGRASNGCRPK
jgi:hypothetical protein